MSAYVCDHKHISQLADYLCFPDTDAPRYYVGHNPEEVALLLWELNVDAVLQRYLTDTRETAPGASAVAFVYSTSTLAVPTGQTLRSLECFLYQCSEGDVPERELFKQLERYADHLRRVLLNRDCKEYREAEWGAFEPKPGQPEVHSLSAMMRRPRR